MIIRNKRGEGSLLALVVMLAVMMITTAPADAESAARFSAEVALELEVPLSFSWNALPPMRIDLYVKAGYTPKF